MLKNKLVIGTVQFGLNYGVANNEGITNETEALNILCAAKSNGINTLDTAILYGRSEEVLGQLGVRDFQIISKIPPIPDNVSNVSDWVDEQVQQSLGKMKISSLYALLLHAPSQLLSSKGEDLYNALLKLKDNGIVKKTGVSIYAPGELDAIVNKYDIDLVQSPFSILDTRIIESGWAQKLKDKGIELHARSIFLQGLLLMNHDTRPMKFNFWHKVWSTWDAWLEKQSVSAVDACISFVFQQDLIDKVVVGFESMKQFNQVINSNIEDISTYPSFTTLNDELINPSKWDEL